MKRNVKNTRKTKTILMDPVFLSSVLAHATLYILRILGNGESNATRSTIYLVGGDIKGRFGNLRLTEQANMELWTEEITRLNSTCRIYLQPFTWWAMAEWMQSLKCALFQQTGMTLTNYSTRIGADKPGPLPHTHSTARIKQFTRHSFYID